MLIPWLHTIGTLGQTLDSARTTHLFCSTVHACQTSKSNCD